MASLLKSGCGQFAMLAALGLFAGAASPATAADLGGNCCADLEERIAELEATTARKGNRKVKLEVSGQVNEMIMWWDDGVESNAYLVTNDNARSRFRFKGEGKINADWKAGYLLEIGVRTSNSKRTTQDDDQGASSTDVGLDIRHSVWYVDSKQLGRLWVGLTGGAGESVTEVNQAATKDILKYSDIEDAGLGMFVVTDGVRSDLQWRRLLRDGGDQPGEGRRWNMVRYDTPEIAGFTGTVNWGEDDAWEAGLRYKGEFGDFKLAGAIAYGENRDGNPPNAQTGQIPFQCTGNVAGNDRECEQLGGSVSVMHSPTGIYVNFGAGYTKDDLIVDDTGDGIPAADAEDRNTFFAGEVGIEQKWNELGKTTLFVQYYRADNGTTDRDFVINGVAAAGIAESELESFGAGIVQGIDNAAMHVYLTYRHYEGDVTIAPGGARQTFDLDDLDVVMGGAIIRF